jgi:[ribosomal protein S5]-alanine N-acetyltransferase
MTWPTTRRLTFGPVLNTEADIREIIGWLNNPDVVRFSEQRHKHHTIETQLAYIQALNPGDLYLAIYENGIMIGTTLATIDLHNMVANVGIMIGYTNRWRSGLGYEAWVGVCDHLLKDFHLIRKVEAGCMACNTGMMGICAHYGMMEEGRQDDHFSVNGSYIDLVHWGKFK